MLNVGDGDAIIIHLKRSQTSQFVILIDGGHSGDANAVISSLDVILADADKKGPDLIICTHYDSDHIGGLKIIAQKYKKDIGQVWIHQPGLQNEAFHLAAKVQENRMIDDFELYTLKNQLLLENLTSQFNIVLESYHQMNDLVDVLDELGIKKVEPFSGQSISGWEEITVLGPTKKFYESCYNKLVSAEKLLITEATAIKEEQLLLEGRKLSLTTLAKKITNPCDYLDEQKKDHVTEVNQVSVILQIKIGDKKYLFTGDASLESFENIPNYPEALKNIFWLKVAHHGSHNNSSSALFDIMRPKYAFISGGNRYLDDEVMNCLKAKGAVVKATRDEDGDLEFPEE